MRAEILVTGGGGLWGHALKKFCPGAVFLTRKDGDLTDPAEARRLFKTWKPVRVLHLAAAVGGVKKNAAQNADLFSENILINTNVLNAAREQGVSRLISVLSSCVFPFPDERPATEEDLHAGMPFEGNLGYGYAKRMLDIQTRLLWGQYGSKFSSLTPVTLYGPNDDWDLEGGHVVASLIHKCLLAQAHNKPLEVWGSGQAVRQFVFAPDMARLLLKALDSFSGPDTVVVAADLGITIAALARFIAKVMNFQGPIVFNPERPEGQKVKVIQSHRFSRDFPGFTFTPLEEGLRVTTQWFSEHYQDASVGTPNF